MSCLEIITLQAGNYSNYVGSHYWNFQSNTSNEENSKLNRGKFFREKLGNKIQVPRVILFDHKSNLKLLKEDDEFVDESSYLHASNGNVDVIKQDFEEKNDVIREIIFNKKQQNSVDLNNLIKSWTDFITFNLDENTVQPVSNQFSDEFNFFGHGENEYHKHVDDCEDKLHYWVEECNSIEGFQLFLDVHDGFSGLANSFLQDIFDEFRRKSIYAYINWPTTSFINKKDPYKILNIAMSLQNLSKVSSLFTFGSAKEDLFADTDDVKPLQGFSCKGDSIYQTSALLASSLYSSTLPCWLESRQYSMAEYAHILTQDQWKLLSIKYGFPFFHADDPSDTLLDVFQKRKNYDFMNHLFPYKLKHDSAYTQIYVLQCSQGGKFYSEQISNSVLKSLGLNYNIFNNPLSLLDYFTERFYPSDKTFSKCFFHENELSFYVPYPDILSHSQDTITMAGFYSSSEFYNLIKDIILQVKNINLKTLPAVQDMGFDNDSKQELLEDLLNFAKQYDKKKSFEDFEDI